MQRHTSLQGKHVVVEMGVRTSCRLASSMKNVISLSLQLDRPPRWTDNTKLSCPVIDRNPISGTTGITRWIQNRLRRSWIREDWRRKIHYAIILPLGV